MITEPSLEEFMKTGNLVWKVGSKSGIKEKFIWANNTEIRLNTPAQNSKKITKIETESILSVWTQERFGNHFLVIDTKLKTYKLQFKSSQITEKWHTGLQTLIFNSQQSTNPTLDSKKLVLGELNKDQTTENPEKATINQLLALIKHHSKHENDLSLKALPTSLECLLTQPSKVSEPEENDPKRLSSKISTMRKRLKMLEIEKEATSQLENLTFLLEKEQKQNTFLQSKISEAALEKSKLFTQWSELNSELEKLQNTHKPMNPSLEPSSLTPSAVMQKVLQKGFICYICTLASSELIDSLNLTPRRGYEEGVFKKRQIHLSSDLKTLIWKPVGLFCKKFFSLPILSICAVIEGTEDPTRFEPYENCKYLTIVSKGLTCVICVENYYGMYLDGIQDLYLQGVGGGGKLEVSSGFIARVASEQLQNQVLTFTRMFKRYKGGLVESICLMSVGNEREEEFLFGELMGLKGLSENMPLGIMAADSESYLRTERKTLIEKMQEFTEFRD